MWDFGKSNGRAPGSGEQRDLGVQIHSSLKVASQIDGVVINAFGMLVLISQSIVVTYKTLLRMHLEYRVHFWALYYRKDVVKLKRVQRRFTRMLLGLEGLSCRESVGTLFPGAQEEVKVTRGIDSIDAE